MVADSCKEVTCCPDCQAIEVITELLQDMTATTMLLLLQFLTAHVVTLEEKLHVAVSNSTFLSLCSVQTVSVVETAVTVH